MGLFDLLSGRPDRMFGRGGGVSPVTMGVLGLLAYKAIQSMNKPGSGESGGGIGDWLHRTLGGDTSSRRDTGGILSGGLRDLIGQFQQSGHGDIARSWVGAGANRSITPDVLAKVLTEEQVATLMAHTGLGRDELLRGMSEELPPAVDKLTPEGDVPSPLEMDEVIGNKPA